MKPGADAPSSAFQARAYSTIDSEAALRVTTGCDLDHVLTTHGCVCSVPCFVAHVTASGIGRHSISSLQGIEPAQANFIPRTNFLKVLCENGEAALHVAQQLGETYHSAITEMRMTASLIRLPRS
jgi:hypothetical protein